MSEYRYYRTIYDPSCAEVEHEEITFERVMEFINEHHNNPDKILEKLHNNKSFTTEFETEYCCVIECVAD